MGGVSGSFELGHQDETREDASGPAREGIVETRHRFSEVMGTKETRPDGAKHRTSGTLNDDEPVGSELDDVLGQLERHSRGGQLSLRDEEGPASSPLGSEGPGPEVGACVEIVSGGMFGSNEDFGPKPVTREPVSPLEGIERHANRDVRDLRPGSFAPAPRLVLLSLLAAEELIPMPETPVAIVMEEDVVWARRADQARDLTDLTGREEPAHTSAEPTNQPNAFSVLPKSILEEVCVARATYEPEEVPHDSVLVGVDRLVSDDCEDLLARARLLCDRASGAPNEPAKAGVVDALDPVDSLELALSTEDSPRPSTDVIDEALGALGNPDDEGERRVVPRPEGTVDIPKARPRPDGKAFRDSGPPGAGLGRRVVGGRHRGDVSINQAERFVARVARLGR